MILYLYHSFKLTFYPNLAWVGLKILINLYFMLVGSKRNDSGSLPVDKPGEEKVIAPLLKSDVCNLLILLSRNFDVFIVKITKSREQKTVK